MKYKVGDKVRVRKDLKVRQNYGDCCFVEGMKNYRGRTVEIAEAFNASGNYQIKEDECSFYWAEEMFEPVMTNFDKVKEEFVAEDLDGNGGICRVIHKIKKEEFCDDRTCRECVKWLKQPYKEPKKEILDKQEKEYLSAAIKPFRNRVNYIKKMHRASREYIGVFLEDTVLGSDDDRMFFPYFKKNAMYKGMEDGKEYTLEELGI